MAIPKPIPAGPYLSSGRQPSIAIVGGSITGPAVAHLLIDAGFDRLAVYEAAPAAASQGGGLITLEHSALDVLDRVGIPQDEFVTHRSETIVRTRAGSPEPVRVTYPGRLSTWTLLHRALAARLPHGVLHAGARVTGLVATHGAPMLEFAGGDAVAADLVVFADGRSSVGRRLLDPGRRLRYAGYVAHRGDIATMAPDVTDFLRFEPCAGVQFNVAPVPGGLDWTLYLNTTAARYADLFGAPPDRRLFALPRHVSATARAEVDARAGDRLPPEQAAVVRATAARMALPVMDIAAPTAMSWPLGTGHAVLLGDALAPVRPHTARGANNGIEQAAGLVAALRQHRKYGADLAGALNGWQRRHLPAAAAAVRLGPVIGARLGLGAEGHR